MVNLFKNKVAGNNLRSFLNPLSAEKLHIRLMDIMLKILLPASFIVFKLTGTFIDFMLGLSNVDNIPGGKDSRCLAY